MARQRDNLSEMLRRQRCIELALADLATARDHFAIAVHRLHAESGLSYASIARILGVTRSRVQQLAEHGKTLDTG